jgi:hypothetical protein
MITLAVGAARVFCHEGTRAGSVAPTIAFARKRRGDTAHDRHERIWQAARMPAEARSRGDLRGARAWGQAQDTEALAQALAL